MATVDRKTLIKNLVDSGAHLTADEPALHGEMIVSTRHTVYRFLDGTCVAVHRQDAGWSRADFVGMKIAGWLVDSTGPVVSPEWSPGASAILVRPEVGGESVALTSPTVHLRRGKLSADLEGRRASQEPSAPADCCSSGLHDAYRHPARLSGGSTCSS